MTSMLTRPGQPPAPRRPGGDAMTVADLAALDTTADPRRYELLDGTLVVTPAPDLHHQDVLRELLLQLYATIPGDLKLFVAPVDVVLDEHTVVQPDLIVVRAADATGPRLTGLPLLAVEILSPGTRSLDLGAKHERYERAGIAHYWVVDPTTGHLRTWELDTPNDAAPGRYQLTTDTSGPTPPKPDQVALSRPYPVTLRPARWRQRPPDRA